MRDYRSMTAVTALMLVLALSADVSFACSRSSPFRLEELLQATVVVRVTALDYATPPPQVPGLSDVVDSVVRFRVDEVLRGGDQPSLLLLPGLLTDYDDFNDQPVPYLGVRRGGRGGSCFAYSYRRDRQFLLFLQVVDGAFTPYWCPLGPTNEQLTSSHDPWLQWVRS